MEHARRTLIAVGGSVLTVGCIGHFTGGDRDKKGGFHAKPVQERPEKAPVTDIESIENTHIRDAVTRACGAAEPIGVTIPPEDFEDTERDYDALPHYTPPAGSDFPYGKYVDCNDGYVAVELVIEV